jgi:hypothetical protein
MIRLYIIELETPRGIIAKIGITKFTVERRIKNYKFSGDMKGKEKDIKIVFQKKTRLAESLEKLIINDLTNQKIQKVGDKNLGSGNSEWYFCNGQYIKMSYMRKINTLLDDDLIKNRMKKERKKIESEYEKNQNLLISDIERIKEGLKWIRLN